MKMAEEQAKPKIWQSYSTGSHNITSLALEELTAKIKADLSEKLNATGEERSFFETEKCLVICGTAFPNDVHVSLGNTRVDGKYVIGNDEVIVVSSKVAGIEAVSKGERDLMVTNDKDKTSAELRYVSDSEYLSEMDWEERSALVIHEFLRSPEGQSAIKKMRGGWTVQTPKFRLNFTGPDGEPFAWKRIFLRKGSELWTDLTDGAGNLVFYSGDKVGLEICPQSVETATRAPTWLPCENSVWENIRIEVH